MDQPIDIQELYSTRLLIFLEDAPQSNNYHQIILNGEEFKTVSLTIGKILSKNGVMENVQVQMSEETYKLPDLREIEGDYVLE